MRQVLTILVPIALPLALYFGYVAWAHRRAQATGRPMEDVRPPWTWLAIAGGLLVLLVLFATWLFSSGTPAGRLHEPTRFIDGDNAPGRVRPPDQPE